MKKALYSRNGNSFVWLCVVVLVSSMLFSVLLLYLSLTAQVAAQKRDVQAKLDSYVSASAVESFNSLKHGSNFTEYLDREAFASGICPALGFEDESQEIYEYPNGSTMTRPECTTFFENGYGVTVRYTASFPVAWNRNTFANLTIPVTVSSYFKSI